jgi:hypothetical protein
MGCEEKQEIEKRVYRAFARDWCKSATPEEMADAVKKLASNQFDMKLLSEVLADLKHDPLGGLSWDEKIPWFEWQEIFWSLLSKFRE